MKMKKNLFADRCHWAAWVALVLVCSFAGVLSADPQPTPLPDGMLLFSGQRDGRWDIYTWDPDPAPEGSIGRITQTDAPEGNPVWWARNKMVVCSQQWDDGRFVIEGFDLNGKEIWHQATPRASLGWPQPSPWDNRILAVREDPQTGEIQPGMMEFPRLGYKTFPQPGVSGGQMAWIDPDEILLTRVASDEFDLCIRSIVTNEEKVIVHGGQNWLAAASPNGGPPFFFSRRVGQICSIFQLSHKSGVWEYDDFSKARVYDWQPSVTPGAEGVIYLSLRNGRFRVIYRPIGEAPEREIPLAGFSAIYHPSWIRP